MSLKQSIVIKNNFSIKNGPDNGKGGNTPGAFVLRYIARENATEPVAPIMPRADVFITRYMARASAVESFDGDYVSELKDDLEKTTGLSGVAFGDDSISLSDSEIRLKSKRIQDAFNKGKTIFKSVISFSEDYLRDSGVLEKGFQHQKKGDYRGHIDQLKLRDAIMTGMRKMARAGKMDDPEYVGAIQVDTNHVHCHFVMVDHGHGKLHRSGTQNGQISSSMRSALRRGIDLTLDDSKSVQYMASQADAEEKNVKYFVKRATIEMVEDRADLQFLLACLPENTKHWRASTNRKDMQKANRLCKDYVLDILSEPDSNGAAAFASILAYVNSRKLREGLNQEEEEAIISVGRDRLIEACMNSVYDVLKQVPDSECRTRTKSLDIMSADLDTLMRSSDDNDFIRFAKHFRSYSSRLEKHKRKQLEAEAAYSRTKQPGIKEEALVVPLFYQIEAEYHKRVASKYRHFLDFGFDERELTEELKSVIEAGKRRDDFGLMMHDKAFSRFKSAASAEAYGKQVYGHDGGRDVLSHPNKMQARLDRLTEIYEGKLVEFKSHAAERGYLLTPDWKVKADSFDFDEVKALDMHDLRYDWVHDVKVSKSAVSQFVSFAYLRHRALQDVIQYLDSSGQSEHIVDFDVKDITRMKECADEVLESGILTTMVDGAAIKRDAGTVSLDNHVPSENVSLALKSVIEKDLKVRVITENQQSFAD